MEKANQAKRKDLASFRVSSFFKVATNNDALGPSLHVSFQASRSCFRQNNHSIVESKSQGLVPGGSLELPRYLKQLFQKQSCLPIPPPGPSSYFAIGKNQIEDVIIMPIPKSEDKPDIFFGIIGSDIDVCW